MLTSRNGLQCGWNHPKIHNFVPKYTWWLPVLVACVGLHVLQETASFALSDFCSLIPRVRVRLRVRVRVVCFEGVVSVSPA